MEIIKNDFSKPFDITGYPDVFTLMPAMKDIPKEFDNRNNKWNTAASKTFFNGLKKEQVKAKAGINIDHAFKHLFAVLSSWSPKHEHKTASVAYLMSLWFDDVKI